MFPAAQRNLLKKHMAKLFPNTIRLIDHTEPTQTLVDGTPQLTHNTSTAWEGEGSIQYVRPRIQKSIADENAGTMQDPVAIVCYVPYEAQPHKRMSVVDVDGVIGEPGKSYPQSRRPANVGGNNVYWELYIGEPVND